MVSSLQVLAAHSLIGGPVRNTDGEDLGRIEELAIDVGSGRIAYAVLSFGGLMGIGDKLFAIPWDAVSFDPDDNEMVLDVPRETLENGPGFDKEHWPDMDDDAWGEDIHNHYGYTPYWMESSRQDRGTIESGPRKE